jgi:hypothetical protein
VIFFRKPNITNTIPKGNGIVTITTNNNITTNTTTNRSTPFTAFFIPDARVEATLAPHKSR